MYPTRLASIRRCSDRKAADSMTIRISLGTVLAALVFIAIGAGTAVGVMLWEPWDGDDDGDGSEAVAEASPSADPTPTSTVVTATATASPTPTCHPISVQIEGTDYFVRFAFVPDEAALNSVRLTEEDGTETELPGVSVDAISTRQCGSRAGKCYTHWFLETEGGGASVDAIIVKQDGETITWEEISTGEERITTGFDLATGLGSQILRIGEFCRVE